MSPTLNDSTRRRLALGLLIVPPNRNRRRRHDGFTAIVLLVFASMLALLITLARI